MRRTERIAGLLFVASLVSVAACKKEPPAPPKEHGEPLALGAATIELPIGALLKSDHNPDTESAKSSHLYELSDHSILLVQELVNRDASCDTFLDALFAAESKSKADDGLKPIRKVEVLSRHDLDGFKGIYVEAGMRSAMDLKSGRAYHGLILLTICDPSAALSVSLTTRVPGLITVEMRKMVADIASSLTVKK
jgi:hypothetical protein